MDKTRAILELFSGLQKLLVHCSAPLECRTFQNELCIWMVSKNHRNIPFQLFPAVEKLYSISLCQNPLAENNIFYLLTPLLHLGSNERKGVHCSKLELLYFFNSTSVNVPNCWSISVCFFGFVLVKKKTVYIKLSEHDVFLE